MGGRRHKGCYIVPAGCAVIVSLLGPILAAPYSDAASVASRAANGNAVGTALHGRVVKFVRNGYEPDGDPVDRVIISAGLHDQRSVLPDTTLVLSTYLENFQTATVPILPDLLRKDVTATSLGGFMQGKAALVDGAGHVRYQGGVLAEVFLDNDVHIVVDMDPRGMPAAASPLRLSGAFTLHKDLTLAGSLQTSRTLSQAEAQALHVLHPRPVSWQAIVGGMHVRYPPMMGTTSNGLTPVPFVPSPMPASARTSGRGTQAAATPLQGVAAGLPPRPTTNTGARPVAAASVRAQQDASPSAWPFALGGVALVAAGAALVWRWRLRRAR